MSFTKKVLQTTLACAALFLAACATQTVRPPVTFSTFSEAKRSVLECDPKKPGLTINVNLRCVAAAENPLAGTLINREILEAALSPQNKVRSLPEGADFAAEVNRYIAEEFRNYQKLYSEYYQDWGHSSGFEQQTSIDGSLRYNDGKRLVYAISVTKDFGGAHPEHWEKFLNFDAVSGKRLRLADVFKPGYEAALTKLLKAKAMQLEKVKSEGELICDPHLTENFILGENDIAFHFNPYEIAPRSYGAIVLEIPYTELQEWLKKD